MVTRPVTPIPPGPSQSGEHARAAATATIDWPRVYLEAMRVASRLVGQDAGDVVNEGVALMLEGAAPWDQQKRLALHLVETGLRARSDQRRTERRRRNPAVVDKLVETLDRAPETPEERLAAAEERARKARMMDELRTELAHDADAVAILALNDQGVCGAMEQAEQSNMSIEAVRNARKRIARCAEEVARRQPRRTP